MRIRRARYGTLDQDGNVWEWDETVIFPSFSRGVRGGAFDDQAIAMQSLVRGEYQTPPTVEEPDIGFRIALVPEPSGIILVFSAVVVVIISRRLRLKN